MAGLAGVPGREWMIRDAKGRKYSYDLEEEAIEALPEYGAGAAVWTRAVCRVLFFTRSVDGWQQVTKPRD
ncbi:hypothetical protein [Streptomyces sp. NPDC001165]|uniref:hypothetical protein n=1 Tax=Streptomyces sp. NPDC001165 TaxID=3364546 RepID=UPI00369542C0